MRGLLASLSGPDRYKGNRMQTITLLEEHLPRAQARYRFLGFGERDLPDSLLANFRVADDTSETNLL